jgi:hypothetical protein
LYFPEHLIQYEKEFLVWRKDLQLERI